MQRGLFPPPPLSLYLPISEGGRERERERELVPLLRRLMLKRERERERERERAGAVLRRLLLTSITCREQTVKHLTESQLPKSTCPSGILLSQAGVLGQMCKMG